MIDIFQATITYWFFSWFPGTVHSIVCHLFLDDFGSLPAMLYGTPLIPIPGRNISCLRSCSHSGLEKTVIKSLFFEDETGDEQVDLRNRILKKP
uniref:Uncharacterized protein n=1 Tax=Arion vulgaris TaxID=1028688 RepID=A0A0B7AXM3_9EUPU